MITVDCSNALAIKDKLLVYVADKLEALPILKNEKFMLDALDDSQIIDKMNVISAIEEFLESVNLKGNFQITPKGDDLKIEPLDGTDMKKNLDQVSDSDLRGISNSSNERVTINNFQPGEYFVMVRSFRGSEDFKIKAEMIDNP